MPCDTGAPEGSLPDPPTKVHIVVAGHEILVEAVGSLDDIATTALRLFDRTASAARHIPLGYDIPAPDLTIAPAYEPVMEQEEL